MNNKIARTKTRAAAHENATTLLFVALCSALMGIALHNLNSAAVLTQHVLELNVGMAAIGAMFGLVAIVLSLPNRRANISR